MRRARGPGLLVVPWPIRQAELHDRKQMRQSRIVASPDDDLSAAIFLPKALRLLDVLDLDPSICRHTFGLGANRLSERLSKLGHVVEQLDAPAVERDRHDFGVTHARQHSLNQHPIEARQHSLEPVTVTFDQLRHLATISPLAPSRFLLGSGYAGVGNFSSASLLEQEGTVKTHEMGEMASAAECRYRASVRRFDLTQSSLVFINTCFAIAFGSIYTLILEAFSVTASNSDRLADVTWSILAGYLVFTVWRQYSTYYIPLQFHSQKAETSWQEMTTLLITVTLALVAVCAAKEPAVTPVFLILLILLNVAKLKQMRSTLRHKGNATVQAINHLTHFAKRLLIYLGILIGLTFVAWTYGEKWSSSTYAIVVATSAIVTTVLTPVVHRRLFGQTSSPDDYTKTIETAWSDDV